MGMHVVAVYRPRPDGRHALEREVAEHVPLLRRLGLATDAPSLVLRASDGSIVEHFEWTGADAIATAHDHPEVLDMWARFEDCCDYGTLAELPNAAHLFAEFELVGRY